MVVNLTRIQASYLSKTCLLALLILIQINWIKGQDIDLSFHHLTEENGLTKSERYFMSKDSRGYVWIGTADGLLRFDGQQIKKYQQDLEKENAIFENMVSSQCFEDQQGNLWFTTFTGVNCYRRATDDFIHFSLATALKNYAGFYLDKEQFWLRIGLGKEGALYHFDLKSKKFSQQVPLPGESCTLVKNKVGQPIQLLSSNLPNEAGLVWIDLENGNRKNIRFLMRSDGTKRTFPSPTKDCLIDEQGIVWVGVYGGLGRYELGAEEGIVIDEFDQDIGWVWAMTAYDENRLLLAANTGLFLFDKRTQKIIKQFKADPAKAYSLKLKKVNNLFLDTLGNLFLSSDQQEVAFASLHKNRFPAKEETLGQFITNISEDRNGHIWCSTLDSGTFVYQQNGDLLFRTNLLKNLTNGRDANLPELYFFSEDATGGWWGNVSNNFLRWKEADRAFEFRRSYFLGVASSLANRVNYCYQLADGKNLIAKGESIYELKFEKEKLDTLAWHNLAYLQLKMIRIIYQDQHKHIFIGDNHGRLLILKEQNQQLVKIADLQDFGICYDFEEDFSRNLIWVASSKGLAKIDANTYEFTWLKEATDNLPNEPFSGLSLDGKADLWLTGNNGLIRYQPTSKAFARFDVADGLLSNVFNTNACLKASQSGAIWVGGKNGVNVFKPEEIELLETEANVQLTRLLVNDETYELDENINEIKNLSFEYDQNTLSFQYVALDYSDPSSNRFYYQMEGVEETPIADRNQGFARYPNLPAGDYVFKIWASNSDDIRNEKPWELQIEIIPPFYQTWWFYLAMLLLISSIIYAIFQYRLEQALKVERMRVKISSDLHDDVGGLLSGLAMQSEILELTASEDVKPKLSRIAELSRSAMSRMRDTVWAIDARKDKLENLIDRMHEHAEETLTPKDFHYDITIEGLDQALNMPTDIRQNLYLIYKEAITNVAKHSNGDEVQVRLEKLDQYFEMNIKDNGKVLEKNYKSSGLGQSNMQMRAKQIGARLEVNRVDGFQINLRMKHFD